MEYRCGGSQTEVRPKNAWQYKWVYTNGKVIAGTLWVDSSDNKLVCAAAERHTFIPIVSWTRASGYSDVNVPYVRLSWWPGFELKLKISNAADNQITLRSLSRRHMTTVGIIESRKQEVNTLWTDSGPLRANTVLCHSTQSSHYLF